MRLLHRVVLAAASAAFFMAAAQAQNAGTVTQHAFAIGKGAGVGGYTSLLCGSAQLAVGQAAADPICQPITGDASLSAGGVLTLSTVNSNVGSFGSATQAPAFTVNAKGLITAASANTITPAIGSVTGLGTGCGTFLATPTSSNLRGCLTDGVGTGAAYFVGGALGTPASATLTNATGLPLAGLNTQGAYTIIGNNTAGSASPTAIDVTALTLKASPGASDIVLIQDASASNAFKKTTVGALGGGGSGVSSLNGQTGALVAYFPPQGRLTLTSGTPVMTTSVAAAPTVYYTPYAGAMVPLYDGTNMIPTAFTEVSQATTDATKSPAAVAASSCYDEFAWNDAGMFRVTRGPAWTNTTTRSAGTALTLVKGIYLNNASITNGPAASRGTYVGTICSNASSSIDYIFGGVAAGGTAGSFNVWNAYNRVNVATFVGDSTSSWNYTTTINTWRAQNSSNSNRVTFVRGLAEDGISASYIGQTASVSTLTNCAIGIGLDSTSAVSGSPVYTQTSTAQIVQASYSGIPGIGQHFLQDIEFIIASAGCTYYGSGGVTYIQTGLNVQLRQ